MRFLVCTDLDRTLLPNGAEPESPKARDWFARLASLKHVTLAYVTGRDRNLVKEAIDEYSLPMPSFILADVGSSLYTCSGWDWTLSVDWQRHIGTDWGAYSHTDLATRLDTIEGLVLQESFRQNRYKLSYYSPQNIDPVRLNDQIQLRLQDINVSASLSWSIDDLTGRGLVDILPSSANKRHAIEFLMKRRGYALDNTLFCGDSGNDLPVLISPIRSVLVHNAAIEVRQQAEQQARNAGTEEALYLARGGFRGMNGNYAAGILEGVCHYHPEILKIIERL